MPGTSIGKAQAAYLKTMHLDEIGESADQPGVDLNDIEEALLGAAAFAKITAEQLLSETNHINSGKLAKSIQFDKVSFFGGEYSVEIRINEYYKFLNSGVNGLKKKYGSPYSFKNMGVSIKMQQSIRKWLIREGLKVKSKTAMANPLGQEKKGVGLKQKFGELSSDQAAFVIAKGIKKNGIKPTRFWDKTMMATNDYMKKELGAVFVPMVINELRKKSK